MIPTWNGEWWDQAYPRWAQGYVQWARDYWNVHQTPPFKRNAKRYGR